MTSFVDWFECDIHFNITNRLRVCGEPRTYICMSCSAPLLGKGFGGTEQTV